MKDNRLLFILFIFFAANAFSINPTKQEVYAGRMEKSPLYQAQVPLHWKRVDPVGDLTDTRLPICSYEMEGGVLTIHTFPEQRIPSEAQVERWKKQVGEDCDITSFAHGGFGGLRLESEHMLAYALQLTPLLFRALPPSEKRADYTLKFVGTVKNNREEIDAFAESFEWIDPVIYENL